MLIAHSNLLQQRLEKFMTRPQRHRLLHGYPLAAAMPYADQDVRNREPSWDKQLEYQQDANSHLLVGVLPHPFCNPKIRGCGYCTFPHENFSATKSASVAGAVAYEIEQRIKRQPALQNALVDGLYIGGGTANLTPVGPFQLLARRLAESFDLTTAEISLEGVPSRFLHGKTLLMDVMRDEIPARHFRISMGIQTFSDHWLEKMGRLAFGHASTFAKVVEEAHRRDFTASGDLLFNLPGQSRPEMFDDVKQAVDIGLDQICMYHLVMFRGLGTAWSQDAAMLASLPSNEEAAEHWLALREFLVDQGYRQTSLTNFEKSEFANDSRRYLYEPISYRSSNCQVVGFGPAGISFGQSRDRSFALKTMNPESSAEYLQSVRKEGTIWNRYFQYDKRDLELLHLTRRLASLQIDMAEFESAFGSNVWNDWLDPLSVCLSNGLLVESTDCLMVTPRGMFYSDSIAALLCEHLRRIQDDTSDQRLNNNSYGHM